MASRREKGYYSALNVTSSVDILPKITKKKRANGRGKLWAVDRLIQKRRSPDKKSNEFLVHWKGYGPYDATWEPEQNITEECIRMFSLPNPSMEVLVEEAAKLRVAVEQHLKSKSRLPMTLFLRGDVYRFFFQGKGYIKNGWHFVRKESFPAQFFPSGWDCSPDSHGQGVKVFYPFKMRHFIYWSPKKYVLSNNSFVVAPRAYQEKLTISFVRVAIEDDSE